MRKGQGREEGEGEEGEGREGQQSRETEEEINTAVRIAYSLYYTHQMKRLDHTPVDDSAPCSTVKGAPPHEDVLVLNVFEDQ